MVGTYAVYKRLESEFKIGLHILKNVRLQYAYTNSAMCVCVFYMNLIIKKFLQTLKLKKKIITHREASQHMCELVPHAGCPIIFE